jgi:hypothetical protein
MDKTSQAGAAKLNRAARAAIGWSPAAHRTACAAVVLLCLFGATACSHPKPTPSQAPGTSSLGAGQFQQQQGGSQDGVPPCGGSLPPLGTPQVPSGHPSTSLPPLGSGS